MAQALEGGEAGALGDPSLRVQMDGLEQPWGAGSARTLRGRGHQKLALGTCKHRGPVTRREVPAGRSRLEAALSCSPGSCSGPRCLVPGPGLWLQGQKVEEGPGV